MPIRILPPEVASQIAAGEVVERPASVVKELVENALDAGADDIRIIVKNAGRGLIEVSDNGRGIPAEEIHLTVTRHATSKLSQAEDLFSIETLGFRGEALASIASISRTSISSRSVDQELGASLVVEGGKMSEVQPFGGPVGTTVQVENLFFNVPARLKFLKTDQTERRVINKLLARYAIAYPAVRFRFVLEDFLILQTSGNGNRREVLSELYDPQSARQLLEVIYKDQKISLTGFISPTNLTRTNRREMYFFVNGRPVQEAALSAAVIKGFHTLLMVGRYPLAALFLEIDPQLVDVNVHPTKAEVRFREPDAVFSVVQSAVRRSLLAHNPVQDLTSALDWGRRPDWGSPIDGPDALRAWDQNKGELESTRFASIPGGEDDLAALQMQPQGSSTTGQRAIPEMRAPILRPIGQIASAYLVAEGPDGLYLVDQHAAHERVLFERFIRRGDEPIPSQALLQPVTIELNASTTHLIEESLPSLNQLGFQVEPFGPNTYLIRRVPAILANSDPAAALLSLVESFEEDESLLQNQSEARLIARICKRSAIKAGATLSPEEQRALLSDLENCQSPRTCPHGRPTMIHLSVDLLERQFGRRGAR